jgi:hypothetical protein
MKICIIDMIIKYNFQSVTGVESSDDHNSYWQVRGKTGNPCERGQVYWVIFLV